MRRLRAPDLLLLLLLLPLWLICFALHVDQARRTGFAWPGLYVVAPASSDEYPIFAGALPQPGGAKQSLEPGDRLLRVGDLDLRGVGPIGLVARALAARGDDGTAPLELERAGALQRTPLQMPASSLPWWWYVPMTLGFMLTGVLILLRAPEPRIARMGYSACVLFSLAWLRFYGPSPPQTYAWVVVYGLSSTLVFPLGLRTALLLPAEAARHDLRARLLPWVFGVMGPLSFGVSFGIPVPPRLALPGVGLLSIAFIATFMWTLTHQYRRADAAGRRQIKWVVYGCYVVGLLPALGALLAIYDQRFWWGIEAGSIAGALAPLFILFAITRYHMLDIDRIISSTASYTVLSVGVIAAATTLVPRAAGVAGDWLGISRPASQAALSLLLAAVAVPIHRRLRPALERRFFSERHALAQGIHELLSELGTCAGPRELLQCAGERIQELLQPENIVIYGQDQDTFVPVFVQGRAVLPGFVAAGPLVATLAARSQPLTRRGWLRGEGGFGPFERAALETTDASVLIPIHVRDSLAGFVILGGKRSGDIYTTTDVALLGAVADRLSIELRRFDDAELATQKRVMYERLRRYVPGALAERLEAGESLEPREREVTVLFCDLRDYTRFSESHDANEVFATINRYAESVSSVVRMHGGTVVEFSGDGMMAVFGAPEALAHKERAAVEAGLALIEAIAGLHTTDKETLRVGVGIATGPAIVGNIRSSDRTLWSAIGNTTNLAARLQGLTRERAVGIVVDSTTRERASDACRGFGPLPAVRLKGRAEAEDLFAR